MESQSNARACVGSTAANAGVRALTARLLDDARIPPRYRKCSLDTFVTYPNEKLLDAVTQAQPLRR